MIGLGWWTSFVSLSWWKPCIKNIFSVLFFLRGSSICCDKFSLSLDFYRDLTTYLTYFISGLLKLGAVIDMGSLYSNDEEFLLSLELCPPKISNFFCLTDFNYGNFSCLFVISSELLFFLLRLGLLPFLSWFSELSR